MTVRDQQRIDMGITQSRIIRHTTPEGTSASGMQPSQIVDQVAKRAGTRIVGNVRRYDIAGNWGYGGPTEDGREVEVIWN